MRPMAVLRNLALLAAVPLRKRTLAALTVNRHLIKIGADWLLDIPAPDIKTRRAMEFPIPAVLSEPIDHYLNKFRAAITGADRHHGLWPSAKGHPMGGGAIYDAVRRRTFPNDDEAYKIKSTEWAAFLQLAST